MVSCQLSVGVRTSKLGIVLVLMVVRKARFVPQKAQRPQTQTAACVDLYLNRSCFKVRTERTNEWLPVLRASSIERWRVAILPPRRIAWKLKTSLRLSHSQHWRPLQDLPVQSIRMIAVLRLGR